MASKGLRNILLRLARGLSGRPSHAARAGDTVFAPNPWVRIDRHGNVTVVIDRSEMGQGVTTSLAMLVAEELEVELERVRTEFAVADPVYNNRLFDEQTTGGSTSVRAAWQHLREAGAAARETLIEAAARRWRVNHSECHAERGRVMHGPSGRELAYGELVAAAARLPVPKTVALKPAAQWRLIGRPVPRIEIPDMVMGRATYGIDVTVPGMVYAAVLRCPIIGGRASHFDAKRALAVPGVQEVVEIDAGIAVVADSFASALRGRDIIEVVWSEGANGRLSDAAIEQRLVQATARRGTVKRDDGDALGALEQATRIMEATYRTPYLAHAPMEPMNCTADVRPKRCDVWVATQAQGGVRATAARLCGLPEAAVHVHTTFLGGAFGRRLQQDFVVEAVQISKVVDAPVQVVWTRQDDMQHGVFRPANLNVLRAALDDRGRPLAWFQRVAGPELSLGGIDIPYAIRNVRVERVLEDPGVPTGAWRSVGASQNAFAVECFIDELAYAAGMAPLDYRLALLEPSPRHRTVLELAADKAGWGRAAPPGRYRGIAVYRSFGSWAAQAAEVSVANDGAIQVHRIVCALDCGITVNPDTITAQTEGAVVLGLSAALKGEITIDGGRVQQKSFEDYPILTMAEMPEVEVHILPSREPPGGVGEPGLPPVAPAVANAVFAATGIRLRRLPLRLSAP